MVIVFFGFCLTKKGYFNMEKQKVKFSNDSLVERIFSKLIQLVAVQSQHGVLYTVLVVYKHCSDYLLGKVARVLAHSVLLHCLRGTLLCSQSSDYSSCRIECSLSSLCACMCDVWQH